MLAFFQTVFTFYHQGFELAKDFEHYKRALQINIQNVRNSLTFLLQLTFLLKIMNELMLLFCYFMWKFFCVLCQDGLNH